MTESWFQFPGESGQYIAVLAKVGGLLVIYLILLVIAGYYIHAQSMPANAIRRAIGLAIGVPFASCMTHILGRHFPLPDSQAETLVFVVFIAITAAITAFINPPPSTGSSHDNAPLQKP